MQTLFDLMRSLHILSGFLAICILWLPVVTKKGGKIHTRIGWVYVGAMTSVSVTALFMGIYRLSWDAGSDPDAIPFSWFLIFIAILSAATAWYGIRVLRFKRRQRMHRNFLDLLFPAALFVSGIGIVIYGWFIEFPLLQYFPLLGLFLGGTQLIYWLTVPKSRSHWIVEHIVGMLSCCIATITAFIVFGAPRLLNIESVNLIVWFLPTILFVPIIIIFSNIYKKKMDGAKKSV